MLHRDVQDPMKDLVEPAVHGTENFLSSVAKSKDTVKKVIQTSSFAGMRATQYSPLYCSSILQLDCTLLQSCGAPTLLDAGCLYKQQRQPQMAMLECCVIA